MSLTHCGKSEAYSVWRGLGENCVKIGAVKRASFFHCLASRLFPLFVLFIVGKSDAYSVWHGLNVTSVYLCGMVWV